jgi:hypothetical protein
MRRGLACAAVLLAVAGCVRSRPSPPPQDLRTIAVVHPANRTGDRLLVAGTSFLEQYAFRTERITVTDVLGAELRGQLAQHGFTVVRDEALASGSQRPVTNADGAVSAARAAGVGCPVLWVAIDRWEPDGGTHPQFVIVALDAGVVDPTTGSVLWHWHRDARPIATIGTVTLGAAYQVAAAKAAEELVGGWRPAGGDAARPPDR